jgi:hypothetical protein
MGHMPGRAHWEGGQEVIVCIAEKCGSEGGQNCSFLAVCSEDSNLSVIRGLEATSKHQYSRMCMYYM